jgi:4-hydroxybenzoate polyprenyltransferase
MNTVPAKDYQGLAQLKLFLALSRTHHGVLDLATPCLGALLWLGSLPAAAVIVLGLATAFAGYTAVYALNDLVDYRSDLEKINQSGEWNSGKDLDAVYARHPLAQGLLPLNKGIAWTAAWAILALFGAYLLNPVCALIFFIASCLEATYCLLLRVTCLRTLVSGLVKTSGGIAAVYAVDPHPDLLFLVVFFLWIFSWEIGGQNVPSDLIDLEEDEELRAKTLPVQMGLQNSRVVVVFSLTISVVLSLILPVFTQADISSLFYGAALITGVCLLLIPAYRLFRTEAVQAAGDLFERGSYYPLAMLVVVMVSLLV